MNTASTAQDPSRHGGTTGRGEFERDAKKKSRVAIRSVPLGVLGRRVTVFARRHVMGVNPGTIPIGSSRARSMSGGPSSTSNLGRAWAPSGGACRRVRSATWAPLLLVVSTFLLSGRAKAHELSIDKLVLWPEPSLGRVRGELTFDPELTRPKDALPTAAAETSVLRLLEDNLTIFVDAALHPLSVDYRVRELWVAGGATEGDVVRLTAELPAGAQQFQILVGQAFPKLSVAIMEASALGKGDVSGASWLIVGGERTPPYPLAHTSPSVAIDSRSLWRSSTRFVVLGFEHIVPYGFDHILFVVGLVIGSERRFRSVLVSLSLFTFAHTLTLALGQFEVLRVSPGWVEPLIALSIAAVGYDNLREKGADSGGMGWRHLVVLLFGLIHGLGFANALTEMAFDRTNLVVALVAFNVGVELGQIAVVAILLTALNGIRQPVQFRRLAVIPLSIVMVIAGMALALTNLAASSALLSS